MTACYGPTENTLFTSCHRMTEGSQVGEVVAIGHPIGNTRVYVLDAALNPVPVGVAGELYAAGEGVARGYLGSAELTAERFVPDVHGGLSGERMYRTGDLARWRADGTLEFLGRADTQVKVRGFRIELGEVEGALRAHPAVKEAVVVAKGQGAGDKRLIAYVVPKAEGWPGVSGLREHVKAKLPEYMVPSAFVALETLPLTSNGKVDRKALPEPESVRPELARQYVAPRTEVETTLAEVWAQVLGLNRVGVQDNFFELGGDSILSLQVVARARRAGLEISPRQLFQKQTVEELAQVAKVALEAGEQKPVEGAVELTPVQQAFFAQERNQAHHFNQSLLLDVAGEVEAAVLEKALNEVVKHHDALRMRFERVGGAWKQHNASVEEAGALKLEQVDLRGAQDIAAQLEQVATQVQGSLELEKGPLVKAVLFELGEKGRRLLVVVHHLVVDGVSWRVVVEDVERACEQVARGEAVELGPKSASYQQWARRLKEYAGQVEGEVAYWESQGAAQVPSLPVDEAGGKNETGLEGEVRLELSREETAALLREVPGAYRARVDEVLLAGLAAALKKWRGLERVRVELEGHGREEEVGLEVSRTVGWFTSVYPVVVEAPKAEGAGAWVRAVKESVRRVPGKGLGFGLLKYLGAEESRRKLRALPKAEVVFNYLGQVDATAAQSKYFAPAKEKSGEAQAKGEKRAHVLGVNGLVVGGRLEVAIEYGRELHRRESVEQLAREYERQLKKLLNELREPDAGVWTAVDFPLVKASPPQLEKVLGRGEGVEDVYPLSPLQQGLLFHSLLEGGSGVYVEQLAWEVRGGLKVEALKQAWQTVVERLSILRTRFLWEGLEEPLQVVQRTVQLPWEERDWSSLGREAQQHALDEYLKEDARQGFELGQAPLMRMAVMKLGEEGWRCVWSHHHLLLDGWSLGLVLEEVFTTYEALVTGGELRGQVRAAYREYIAWLAKQDTKKAEAYWREALKGVSAPTRLPLEARGAKDGSHAQDELVLQLTEEETSAVQGFAQRQQVTVNTLAQGAWALVLGRHAGEGEVVFGATVAGRPAELDGVEGMVGLFINTLPVRVKLGGGEWVESWLKAQQEQQAEQRQYEQSPLVRVQGWSEVPRGQALFESLLVFENYPIDSSLKGRANRWEVGDVRVKERTNYALTLSVIPDRQLRLMLAYDVSRFEARGMDALLKQWKVALLGLVASAGKRLADVSLLTQAERQQVLETWSGTRVAFPEATTVASLFEAQVDRAPDAVAVEFEGQRLTYRELDVRANQLARALHRLGVGPEVRVGLCLERSLDVAVALLGVLKAGGAYLPLDPMLPRERLAFMLSDSGAEVLLTQGSLRERLPETSARTLCLDEAREALLRESGERVTRGAGPGNLAYIIYTSGSTGTPKGTAIEHRSVANLVTHEAVAYGIGPGSRVLQFANLSFDLSVEEIFTTLTSGATLVLAPAERLLPGDTLSSLLRDANITVLSLTPAALAVTPSEGLPALRTVISGGEALPAEVVTRWAPGRRFVNSYGPTEATVVATLTDCVADGRMPSIGRPLANVRTYVLDARGGLVALGVAGELYLGGVGVARGYPGRPELTAERFVPDAFGGEPGARLYRTGDVARWREDGSLEFVGRADTQVKVRGFRIELGEVEGALRAHPAVKDAVVMARGQGAGDKRLVAYVVGHGPAAVDTNELRQALKTRLPEYMVPSAFVALETLPLTSNGKVDRKALPEPEGIRPELARQYVAPRTEMEKTLAEVWAQVLGLNRVGVQDNFFELGGDSILSLQVVSRVRRAGLEVTPKQLFQKQTVEELAQVVKAAQAVADQGPVEGPVELTAIQKSFLEEAWMKPSHSNQSLLLEVSRALDAAVLEKALGAVVKHHDALRMRFERVDGEWKQRNASVEEAGALKLEQVDLRGAQDVATELEQVATQVQGSLDLEKGPLVKAVLFELGEKGRRLLVVVHHLVVDGVSWRVLVEDVERACEQVELGPKSASYQQWAKRLKEYAGQVEGEVAYWEAQGAAEVPSLPVDEAGGKNETGLEGEVRLELSREETAALLREVPGAYRARVDEVLLAGLAAALKKWRGLERVRVELEGHGREEEVGLEVSRTVGWFTSVYPVVVEAPKAEGAGAWVRAVKESVRRVPGKGLGFGLLKYLGAEESRRKLRALPKAEVVFNYLGQVDATAAQSKYFAPAKEKSGEAQAKGEKRAHVLGVNGLVVGGRLEVAIDYGRELHRRESVEELARHYAQELRQLLRQRTEPEAGLWTAVDFPLVKASPPQLEKVLGRGEGVEDVYPLSPLQQGLLFHSLLEGGSGVYVEQLAWEVRGGLKVEALKQAWQTVVERLSILRTRFLWEGLEEPLQVVQRTVQLPWEERDWSSLGREAQQHALDEYLKEDARQGFELGQAPLMRMAVMKLGEDGWRCVWSHHHLLLDGWSLGLVLDEVFTTYEALVTGGEFRGQVRAAYREYIAWLAKQDTKKAEAYWREALKGVSAPTRLPLEARGAKGGTSNQDEVTLQLTEEETSAVQGFAQRQQVTVNTLAQGAWALVLGRHAGEGEVVFGATVAGRPAELDGVEGMVGLFINTLPVRVQLPGDGGVAEWLKGLQKQQAEQQQFEQSPLVQVQGWSNVPRGQQLFDSLLIFENYPVDESLKGRASRWDVRDVRSKERTNYALTLSAMPGSQLRLKLVYETPRFEQRGMDALLNQWKVALLELVASAGKQLSEVTLLTEAERQQVLKGWNATEQEYARESSIAEEFSRQVAQRPDAVAVECGEEKLTYGQLDEKANQLAHLLRSKGVGAEERVGLCLERSVELVVALVGIAKSGGAYVPLEADYPQARLEQMVGEVKPRVVVTRRALAEKLPVQGVECVLLEEVQTQLAQQPKHAPRSGVGGRNLAYIDFTSGSTGKPKGVCTEQRGVLRTVKGTKYAQLGPEETLLLIAPVSFDASTLEVWGSLLNGARLVVYPPGPVGDVEELKRVVKGQGVTTLHLTAGLFAQVVDADVEVLRGLKQLLTGGDVVSAPHVRRVVEELKVPVTACYGPTENTLFTSCHRMTEGSQVGEVVAIGQPIGNTRVYVLDAALNPVPVGVAGELYAAGEGVARGYLGSAELTAERFVPDLHSGLSGERMYRTGDLARWRADGTLEFLGRADTQVKVRGFRIELGEVEGALRAHPAVKEAVVVAKGQGAGDKRLIAYVVGHGPEPLDVSPLRQALGARLPEYMVPSAFVTLEALPLTSNGKVDRKALPEPEGALLERAREYVAPRTDAEKSLADVWTQVLGAERVGVHDSFFELGGHSLLATRAISRIREALKVELPLKALFDAPTVAELASLLQRSAMAPTTQAPPLVRADRSGPLPLSFAQQRLWFLEQLAPGGSRYNIPAVFQLEGALDVAALRHALHALQQRHESLRTSFRGESGQVWQVIASEVEPVLELVDLRPIPDAEREAKALRQATREAQRPFDLGRSPLLRTLLLRLGEHTHVLVLTVHHIVFDGWSTQVLVRDLTALYDAHRRGHEAPLPPLSMQYADYAVWQRAWLQGEALESQLAWWRAQLDGAPPALELPTDKPRPAAQSSRGASHPVSLPRELVERLKALGQREGATPFMVMLAAFQALLYRYSGQDDISVGSPGAGRGQLELEGVIGFFINTLVLRTRMPGPLTFQELLARVREVTLGAHAHQDVPFERLVDELRPERDLSRNPLFQAWFVLNPEESLAHVLPGLTLRPLALEDSTTQFDLTLSLVDSPDGFSGALSYATDLFEPATIARMSSHLRALVEALVESPTRPLATLPMLAPAERHQLLRAWNDTARPVAAEPVHRLFEAQVRRTPDAIAVTFDGQELTYAELNGRANQLARYLRARGVLPDVLVGLYVDRSLELLVGVLGILKSGAAYVPLDPALPEDRLELIADEARTPLLLTQESLADQLSHRAAHTLCLDLDWDRVERYPDHDLEGGAKDSHLAYVIFTSGSTGTPKGVLLEHRGLTNTTLACIEALELGPGKRVLQFFSSGFDASVWEIFPTLVSGARLTLARRDDLMPGTSLKTLLAEQAITTVTLTPSVLAQLSPDELPALKVVAAAGEACTPEVVARWKPGRRFINAYGPTETTICATFSADVDAARPTIGQPITNAQVYVLDAHLEPVPTGLPGELYIGGAGVGRGYLGRPELTADRFVPDPFRGAPGARLYRTGDLVRWLPEGSIEFLGRLDNQVKLRGYRVELGEVEAVLLKHPGVREAVVLVREDAPGLMRMVAYHVGEDALPAAELRSFLQARLPEYMVPSAFVALPTLPLSSSGKVDKQALPVPETLRAEEDFVGPSTDTERRLAAIWSELLGVERVSVHDSFFDLGGHSLVATQLLSRIRNGFQVELPLRVVFEARTLAEQAARVDALAGHASGADAFPLRPMPRRERMPMSFAQQRLWFLDQLEPGMPFYNIPIAVRVEGALNADALDRAFQEVVRRHESLRTTFHDGEDGPAQVVWPQAMPPLSRMDLRELPEAQRDAQAQRLQEEEARRPFDLARGPLVRATLLWLSEESHLLLLTMHHIVSDGWSMGVLVREVVSLYGAYRDGQPSPLPELTLQYADYAAWQRQWLREETLETQLGYWRKQLEGAPSSLELPADRPRPAVRSYRGGTHVSMMDARLAGNLEALGQREGATLFMVLMAGFQSLLHRYSGQTDLVVGTDVANRNHAETESLIGFFINQLVLRLRMEGDPTFTELLAQAKQVSMDAYAHQDLPFEEVVRAINPDRTTAHAPLFQVKFVLQNMPVSALELPGLKVSAEGGDPATAKLDLTVLVNPRPDGLVITWMYSMDLFDEPTIALLARRFQRLLEGVVAQKGGALRLSQLPLLSEEERKRVLVDWNDTAAPYERRCIHELISEQAARVPDAVAVVAGDERLTYAELELKANQLAHWLKALGVGPETRVGLFVERRAHALVGMLGILKAGGAYVALDPAHAHMSERVRHVLNDARVQVIVTEEALANELPSQGEFLVSLDAGDGLLESQPEEAPDSGAVPGNVAYVIYTSGSTGQPKGVCIEHGQLACYVAGVSRRLDLPREMSFASVSTLAADLGHTALFPTLCAGGAVHLVDRRTVSDSALMTAYGREHQVEGLKIVPTHLEALLADEAAQALLPRKRLVLGGDKSEWALVERVHALAPECEVFNHYGPTETTVGVLAQKVERGVRVPGAQTVPLGKPLGNVRVYVLDGYGQPVPPGVPGELFVGGESVGRGYLGRPDLTAERFLPDGFSGVAGARLYRTGDRVRWLEDGRIEFLGRVDHQLKIRGYRVELGEVEAVLAQQAGVGECVVVARDEAGGKQLVAYAVAKPGVTLEEAGLRDHLAARLPDYMVPSAFVVLEALPLTSNGKVDRKALPAPSRVRTETSYTAPRTQTEERLAVLWRELLNVPRVGVHDDFFDLGGHSLLATQVVARVRALFEVQLAVIDLFEAPTLEGLAARIEAGTSSDSPLVTLRKGGEARPFFCVHPVGGSVLGYLELARRLPPEQPVYGLQVPASGGGETVEEMATRYLESVREVQPEGPYLLGGWSLGGRVAYEMARQLEALGEQVGMLVVIDASSQDEGPAEEEWQGVLEFADHLSKLSGVHPRAAEVLQQVDAVELRSLLEGPAPVIPGIEEEACEELRGLWRVFARNRRAARAFVPGSYGGSLVLLRAAESPPDLEADLGWGRVVRG
ncbi:non-ribosomal peptide synthase/polyketide synthase, partial [Corallococcus exiguus]|uniref:non-ribosomal peptide synthase/polyketide synthase n=1 Tax=Corallococcus exiguus TaxID=83462 RepID=UPI003211B000